MIVMSDDDGVVETARFCHAERLALTQTCIQIRIHIRIHSPTSGTAVAGSARPVARGRRAPSPSGACAGRRRRRRRCAPERRPLGSSAAACSAHTPSSSSGLLVVRPRPTYAVGAYVAATVPSSSRAARARRRCARAHSHTHTRTRTRTKRREEGRRGGGGGKERPAHLVRAGEHLVQSTSSLVRAQPPAGGPQSLRRGRGIGAPRPWSRPVRRSPAGARRRWPARGCRGDRRERVPGARDPPRPLATEVCEQWGCPQRARSRENRVTLRTSGGATSPSSHAHGQGSSSTWAGPRTHRGGAPPPALGTREWEPSLRPMWRLRALVQVCSLLRRLQAGALVRLPPP